MIFREDLAQKILDELKRQTRRPVKPGDKAEFAWEWTESGELIETTEIAAVWRNNRRHWSVGNTYAIQTGRGKPAIAHFKLLLIRREAVREISYSDAIAEGFETREQFFDVWDSFYGNRFPVAWALDIKLVEVVNDRS